MQAKRKIVWWCVSSSEHLYFIWRPDDEKVQGAKSQSRLIPQMITRPFQLGYALRKQKSGQIAPAPLCRSITPTPLRVLLPKRNVFEERKELVHLGI